MEVIWTNTAAKKYDELLEYLLTKFSHVTMVQFMIHTEKQIETISKFYDISQVYLNTEYRYLLLSEQTYLFYKTLNNTVYIAEIWDNRQNLVKLNIILHS